jgi:hypothetical protein
MSIGPPTLTGFQAFLINPVGITATVLPPTDFVVTMAFDVAMDIVNLQLQAAAPDIYTLAVYNLATSNVIYYGQDQPNAPIYQNKQAFFAYMRTTWNILGFSAGVIQSSSDVSTSESMVVQDAAKDFTLADLQYLKDPYGRRYLQLAQKYGTLWGVS